MFCPTCGRDNANGRKFCASCGTNLEAVSQALSESRDDFFTKTDTALDQFIARYAEHVFKDAPSKALDRKVGKSWQLLGQGILASFMDMIMFFLMWNVFPLRLLILMISTPVRLLSERSKYQKSAAGELAGEKVLDLSEPLPQKWLSGTVVSVAEHTTVKLVERDPAKQNSD